MTRRFILATLAGMLTIAIAGGVLYGVLFARFFRANIIDLSIMKDRRGSAGLPCRTCRSGFCWRLWFGRAVVGMVLGRFESRSGLA